MPIKNITRLLIKAKEKQRENAAWEMYLTIYPNMTKDTFISFEDFYNPKANEPVREKSEEETLEEVKEILNSYSGGEENRII